MVRFLFPFVSSPTMCSLLLNACVWVIIRTTIHVFVFILCVFFKYFFSLSCFVSEHYAFRSLANAYTRPNLYWYSDSFPHYSVVRAFRRSIRTTPTYTICRISCGFLFAQLGFLIKCPVLISIKYNSVYPKLKSAQRRFCNFLPF